MIVVIADDISGAAELANAARQAGLSAEVQFQFSPASAAQVLCLDTASRSLPPAVGAPLVEAAARAIAAAHPSFVYKKCDSILRGAVAAESLAIARALGRRRVLLISANPSRGRLIRRGQYYVNGVPLDQTDFAKDPEHPRKTSVVADLVGRFEEIETPDIASPEDLRHFAATLDDNTLPAGAVDFFSALLEIRLGREPASATPPDLEWKVGGPALFVCGSHAAWLADRAGQVRQYKIPVFPMPKSLFQKEWSADVLARWAAFTASALREHGAALMAIGGEEPAPDTKPECLAHRLAEAVELVWQQSPVARIYLEGGATATAVLRQLGWTRFQTGLSPGAGVGALLPIGEDGPVFFVKPGSYPWPGAVWRQFARDNG